MGWIAGDDPGIDSVSQNPADQSERSGRCAGTTAHVRPAAQLVGLAEGPCLARHDVAHDFCEDRLGQILDPTRSKQGNNVPLDRSEEHTSELQSLMRTSYAVFCGKKKRQNPNANHK